MRIEHAAGPEIGPDPAQRMQSGELDVGPVQSALLLPLEEWRGILMHQPVNLAAPMCPPQRQQQRDAFIVSVRQGNQHDSLVLRDDMIASSKEIRGNPSAKYLENAGSVLHRSEMRYLMKVVDMPRVLGKYTP